MNGKREALLNFITSVAGYAVILVFGFVVPKIVLDNYGSDVNGLTSTVTQIFTYAAILEAGIGASARNALFMPISKSDKEGISAVLSSARNYFRKVTYIYAFVVLGLAFGIPFLLKTSVDYWTVFWVVLFEGLTNVISFYFINTWSCFLGASGRNYITNLFDYSSKAACYVVKILLALARVNIAFIQIGYFVVSLLRLFTYFVYMRKNFGWINYKAECQEKILKDRSAYLIAEVAWTIFSSTDLIILSIFISTSLASVYSVYNMIFIALNGILSAIYSSLNYRLGLAFQKGKAEYTKVHDDFNSFFLGMMTVLMCTTYVLLLPFVGLYTSNISDTNYIYQWLPLCFCLVQLLSWSRYVPGNLIGIAGLQRKAVWVNVVEAFSNLILSITLVNFMGITGVILATVLSLPLKVIYCIYYGDVVILERKPNKTLWIILVNYLCFFATVCFVYFFPVSVSSYLQFLLSGLIVFASATIVVFCVNLAVNPHLIKVLKRIFRRR